MSADPREFLPNGSFENSSGEAVFLSVSAWPKTAPAPEDA
jgi:hypothetical protein